METDIVALFVPMVSMIVIGLTIVAFFYYRHKNKSELQKTIQQALEKGQDLTPDLIDRLAGPKQGPQADLRKSLVWLATGLGFVLFGIVLGEEDATRAMAAIGMFPVLIGLAYLVMWKLSKAGD